MQSGMLFANRFGGTSTQIGIPMTRRRIATLITATTFLLVGSPLVNAQSQAASTTAANDLPAPDKAFVQAASMSSSTEIDASKLAMKNSQDKDVKSFARHMAMDHTKLTVSLKMAAPHGVAVPKDNSDTEVLDSLRGLKGKAFDDAYIQKVGLEGHTKAVAAFKDEINNGQNADLKEAAQKALPTIQEHLQMAQTLATKKGVSGAE